MIPEEVRRFAEDPGAWSSIEPESGLTRVLNERYCLLLGPVATFTSVSRLRLDPESVAETLAEIRSLVADRGHRETMWWVGSSAAPADLADILTTHGLVPDERPGSEPHAASLALAEPPPPAAPDVTARRVATFEEFRRAGEVSAQGFGAPAEEAEAWEAIAEERWVAERSGHAPRTYIAELEGEIVGVARALHASDCPAVLLLSGAVLEAARGRGVYRALVRVRWDDAVAAGTPALCTHAGALSRPILERFGFVTVAEQEILLDPSSC
jgi:hypothetical protein